MRVLKCSGVLMGLIRGCGAQKTAHLNTFVSSHNIAYRHAYMVWLFGDMAMGSARLGAFIGRGSIRCRAMRASFESLCVSARPVRAPQGGAPWE